LRAYKGSTIVIVLLVLLTDLTVRVAVILYAGQPITKVAQSGGLSVLLGALLPSINLQYLRQSSDAPIGVILGGTRGSGPPTFWRVGDGPPHFVEQSKSAEFKLQTALFMQTPNKNE